MLFHKRFKLPIASNNVVQFCCLVDGEHFWNKINADNNFMFTYENFKLWENV